MQFFSKKIFCASQSVLEKQKTTSFVLLQPPFPCKKTTFQILFPSFVYISIHISQSNLSQSFQKSKKNNINLVEYLPCFIRKNNNKGFYSFINSLLQQLLLSFDCCFFLLLVNVYSHLYDSFISMVIFAYFNNMMMTLYKNRLFVRLLFSFQNYKIKFSPYDDFL